MSNPETILLLSLLSVVGFTILWFAESLVIAFALFVLGFIGIFLATFGHDRNDALFLISFVFVLISVTMIVYYVFAGQLAVSLEKEFKDNGIWMVLIITIFLTFFIFTSLSER